MTKRQYLPLLSMLLISATYADNSSGNSLFQQMDNQIGLGLSYDNIKTYNSTAPQTGQNSQNALLNLSIEQLFDNNIWLNLNASFAFKVLQAPSGGFDQTIQEFGFPADLSGKVGYSFNWASLGLQVIPYVTAGHMLNYNGQAISQNGFNDSSYNTIGAGGRIEYVFVPGASLYFDQNAEYLDDPSNGAVNQSAMSYTSTLGIRYNATQKLQLSLQGDFNQTNVVNSNVGYNTNSLLYQNISETGFGGMFMLSYLFDNTNNVPVTSSIWTTPDDTSFAAFDNDYLLGMGFATATNSYAHGGLAAINSNINYYTLAVTHLFDNGVWANINGQLINNISQNNTVGGVSSALTPTYFGFPGNALLNVGYAFAFPSIGLQVIPYGNAGAVSNINSYNIRSSGSITSAISTDKYYQYGAGGRVEYNIDRYFQLYLDQLFAVMDDQSSLNLNGWDSTSKIGSKINLFSNFQINLDGFYNIIMPTGNTSNPISGVNYAANQNTLGIELSLGFHY